jgi:hypothetical protein
MHLIDFHQKLGHASEEVTKQTVERLGIKLVGPLKSCEDCILGKIWRKNLNKFRSSRSKIQGEKILIDISYIKTESLGGKNTWLLVEDQATSMKWSYFMRRKGELIKKMMVFVKTLKAKNPEDVKYIRLDNAGENLGLRTDLELEGINTNLEFTSPETPEQNGQVERSFVTLWGRVRAMLNCSGVPQEMRDKLWAEFASTATHLSNVMS